MPADHEHHSWQSFMILIDGISRDLVRTELSACGVETNLGAQALNCLVYFREKYGTDERLCPLASDLYQKGLVLPLYGKLNTEQIEAICDRLTAIVAR